jgi:hypothetical protein
MGGRIVSTESFGVGTFEVAFRSFSIEQRNTCPEILSLPCSKLEVVVKFSFPSENL